MTRTTTSFCTRIPTSLAIAAVLLGACPALAMHQEEDPPLLAGPTIDAAGSAPTLVVRDFAGALQRLDRHPAVAALDHVLDRFNIDQPTRASIQAVLGERRKALDELVIDRLDLLIKLSNGGGDADRAEAIRALREALAPTTRKGRLGDRLRALMPADAAAEHQRLEREYVQAVAEDRVQMLAAEAADAPQRALRLRAQAIEMLVGLGAEVRSAYERTLVQRGQELESLIASLNLLPEQDGKVRTIIREYTEQTLLDKDARDDQRARTNLFLRVAAELTPQQRRKLLEHVRGN